MLYGFRDGSTVYVTAGDNQSQYDIFVEGVGALELNGETPNVFDLMSNSLTSGMDGVFRIEFDSEEAAIEAAARCDIELEAPVRAREKRIKMQIAAEEEAERADKDENGLATVDHRTIEEIYGLVENDKWDKKTPEQIEQMEKMKEKMKEAKQNGGVSGESFAPRKRKDDLARVWETKVYRDANGNIQVGGVLATKGAITMRQSREFLFAVTDDTVQVDDTGFFYTVVAITMKEDFDATGTHYQGDISRKMNGIIPKALEALDDDNFRDEDDDLGEIGNIFTYKGLTPEAVRATLLARGFREDQKFNDLVAKDTGFDMVDTTTAADLTQAVTDVEVQTWQTEITDEDAATYIFETKTDIAALMEDMISATGVDPGFVNIGSPQQLATVDGQFAKEFGYVLDEQGIEYDVSPAVPEEDRVLSAPSSVAIIFRLDTSLPLIEAVKTLKDDGVNIDAWTMRRGVRSDDVGSYFICAIERFAKQILTKLGEHHSMVISEIYGIDIHGSRIVPKGSNVTVVDQNDEPEIGPRAWNAEAPMLAHLTDEEREENERAITAKEFIFSGSWNHETRTTTIYITPESYFKEWKDFWNESMPLGHILPEHLKEVEPGVYETKSVNYNDLTFELCKRGFEESNALRLWLNNQ